MKSWFKEDPYRLWILVGGFLLGMFFGQGIPIWDDDFTSWFWKIKDKSIFQTIFEVLSPISTQPQFWGFNERPIQALVYQLGYLISGYESWSYFVYKSLIIGGLALMVYLWGLRLIPKGPYAKMAALASAVLFILVPGTMASHVIHSDLATTAEFLFLLLTYLIWGEVERTPAEWTGFPAVDDDQQRAWIIRWSVLSFCTYLAYKSKADLKLIPAILAAYVFLVRRKQWKLFTLPVGLMVLLAVPWGGAIFKKLPPFMPGSQGSEIGWMWQPASFERLRDFLWTVGPFDFIAWAKSPTLSLAGLLGPFLLAGVIALLGWKAKEGELQWKRLSTPIDRARAFALIWFGVILVGVSALPAINYIFRVRYGIITMVPVSLLLAWVFGIFADSHKKLPKWAIAVGVGLFVIQAGANLTRSITFRRDLGLVMVAVDQVYEHVAKNFPNDKLTLFPDFRPYDYRPSAPSAILQREWLSDAENLQKKNFPAYTTYAISWKPSLWPLVEMVEHFPGCRETTLFDKLFPCASGHGAYLMRYIGEDPLYKQGEELRHKGDVAGARKIHEEFVSKHPQSLAGLFVLGLEAYQMQDWVQAQKAYATLEKYLPDHMSILYNHALALSQLQQYKPAIDRLKYIVTREPNNYPVWINLYWSYAKDGQEKKARDSLIAMKKLFPNDGEVNRLLAAEK